MDYRRRSLNIEDEFSRLLEKYDNHVALINGHDSYGQNTWNKLVDEIERFNSDS
jgi:succinate dehydrogenase flavin-adding protein (antitoxin of CptAB toxin-antitoxin module)